MTGSLGVSIPSIVTMWAAAPPIAAPAHREPDPPAHREPEETAEVGTPSMDTEGKAQVTSRRAGTASKVFTTETTTMIRSRSTCSIWG